MFKKEQCNWMEYRKFPDLVECDFHWSELGIPTKNYHENMADVREYALIALKNAYQQEKRYVLFTHGGSTSHRGKTTARSQIRGLMRSKDATPYIRRRECIQHPTVFVAAIRPFPTS